MPLITDDQETFKLPASTYGYSGAKLDTLSASEYTLVQGIFDESGSTSPFAKDMNKCMMEIVQACRHSPRADNLMLRQLNFGSRQREVLDLSFLLNVNRMITRTFINLVAERLYLMQRLMV
jgi:predicted MarR family transcription regulator